MSESLFAHGLRTLGAVRLRDHLAGVRLRDFVPEPPEAFAQMSALDALDHLWELVGRPEQLLPPGDWTTWLIQAGRGWGKTRTGAQSTLAVAQDAARMVAARRLAPEEARLAAIAPTSADARDVLVEGPGGLLRSSPPWFPGAYEPSKRKITYPAGVEVHLFSAEEPERLRGPQHLWLWCDEFCAWQRAEETLDNALMGLRLGARPRCLITTTPRPSARLRKIIADPHTVVTRGATRDNVANLAPSAVERLYAQYGGTRLGRQELEGEILTDNPAALWKPEHIEGARVAKAPDLLRRIVVAIDPAVSNRPDSDETGIIVAAIADCGCKGETGLEALHYFVLDDRSGRFTPDGWARTAVAAYRDWQADRIVGEANQGGALIESTLRTLGGFVGLPFTAVHASRGKAVRAEPIAALYEQGKVHHVGTLPQLEDQLVQWNPIQDTWSPDRLDALVWALTDLLEDGAVPLVGIPW